MRKQEQLAMRTNTLRPGLLVSLKTSVKENVRYEYTDIEPEHLTEEGQQLARWETSRSVADPTEHEAAKKVRSRICTVIRSTCVRSSFGLLCPEKSADDLDSALTEARRLAEEFNAVAKLTRVNVYVLVGRIVPDDLEALRAINSEARDLLTTMAEGIRTLDVTAVRDAADRARDIGRMLTPEAQARIGTAVEEARAAARKIVKAGEQAAKEIDEQSIRRITEARTAFLDTDPAAEIAAPVEEARALDLEPLPETNTPPKKARGRTSAPAPV
jgi:hypothetical protein